MKRVKNIVKIILIINVCVLTYFVVMRLKRPNIPVFRSVTKAAFIPKDPNHIEDSQFNTLANLIDRYYDNKPIYGFNFLSTNEEIQVNALYLVGVSIFDNDPVVRYSDANGINAPSVHVWANRLSDFNKLHTNEVSIVDNNITNIYTRYYCICSNKHELRLVLKELDQLISNKWENVSNEISISTENLNE